MDVQRSSKPYCAGSSPAEGATVIVITTAAAYSVLVVLLVCCSGVPGEGFRRSIEQDACC